MDNWHSSMNYPHSVRDASASHASHGRVAYVEYTCLVFRARFVAELPKADGKVIVPPGLMASSTSSSCERSVLS